MPANLFSVSHFLASEADTSAFGVSIATVLEPGDTVLLDGPIGAGKTHLARAIILAKLDVPEDVPSPTYTLVQMYQTSDGDIWHADLYRLGDVGEIEELGLIDAFGSAITLIEWPDRLGALAPDDALTIAFRQDGDGRRVDLTSSSDKWAKLMDVIAHV